LSQKFGRSPKRKLRSAEGGEKRGLKTTAPKARKKGIVGVSVSAIPRVAELSQKQKKFSILLKERGRAKIKK